MYVISGQEAFEQRQFAATTDYVGSFAFLFLFTIWACVKVAGYAFSFALICEFFFLQLQDVNFEKMVL